MKYLILRSDGSVPPPATFSKTKQEKVLDAQYDVRAKEVKARFPKVKEIITDLESLKHSGAEAGDIIYCPHRLGEPALAWTLRNPLTGEAQLLGTDTLEDLEWYLHFGHLELLDTE